MLMLMKQHLLFYSYQHRFFTKTDINIHIQHRFLQHILTSVLEKTDVDMKIDNFFL